jgi:Bacterial Ig domain/WD40-like Beta Propeller Repeat
MRWSAILVLACLVALATLTKPAFAASNGMLAAVAADGKVVTVNANGSGLRTLWAPSVPVTGLAWSPDGNKLAMIAGDKLVVFDVTGATVPKSLQSEGTRDADPTWSTDGARIGFRRFGPLGQSRAFVSAGLDKGLDVRDPDLFADDFAFSPKLTEWAYRVGPQLFWSGMTLELVSSAVGAPAWSSDGGALAFAAEAAQFGQLKGGLYTWTTPDSGAKLRRVAHMPASAPRWSPRSDLVLYRAGNDWQTVPSKLDVVDPDPDPDADAVSPTIIRPLAGATLADWQPCTPGVSSSCVSVAPPVCASSSLSATTQADKPVDLPDAGCTDPAGRGLSTVVVKAPEHGTLTGQRYTPAPGFVGQDGLTYKVSNGAGESDAVSVKIFVVPRAAAVLPSPPPAAPRAPFLTARATPKLDRKRTTLVKLACDQNCSFEVRLTGELKKPKKKSVKGSAVKRTLGAGGVLSLRLRLPTKPKGKLKTVWITGTVRNAAGAVRTVKLPVRLPR